MVEVNPLDDIMVNFKSVFFTYVILFIIICINFAKTIYIKKNLTDNNIKVDTIQIFDLFVDVLCGICMASGLMFMGVLADNNALNWSLWAKRLELISIISFIVFLLNAFLVFKTNKNIK